MKWHPLYTKASGNTLIWVLGFVIQKQTGIPLCEHSITAIAPFILKQPAILPLMLCSESHSEPSIKALHPKAILNSLKRVPYIDKW